MSNGVHWKVLPLEDTEPILYRFAGSEKSYTFTVTDLRNVYEETLDLDELEVRGKNCIVSITRSERGDQLHVLFENLATALCTKGDVKFQKLNNGVIVDIEHRIGTNIPVALNWQFRPGWIKDSSKRLAQLNLELLEVVTSMAAHIERLQTLVSRKDYHILSLNEQLQSTGGEYTPRKFRDAFNKYNEDHDGPLPGKQGLSSVADALNAAEPYWPEALSGSPNASTEQPQSAGKERGDELEPDASQSELELERRKKLEGALASKRHTKKRKRFL
jgi:hypothetical protein